MAHTVVGVFDNPSEAQSAVQQLVSSGFSQSNIDISSGSGSTGTSSGSSYDDGSLGTSGSLGNTLSNAGSSMGNTLSNAGSSMSDRLTGSDNNDRGSGISRFFKSLFGDDDNDADTYSKVAQRGSTIVTVHAQSADEADRAADLLDDYGAVNVNEKAAEYGYSSGTARTDLSDQSSTTIPKIQEELEVGKRTVETGKVRIRSRVVERPVEESIRLREEHVNVERNTVNRAVTGDELANFQEGEIELTERAEIPVVNKQARVVEEVRLSKDVSERNETISDTVRNTEIDIDNIEGSNKTTQTNIEGSSKSGRLDSDDLTSSRNL